MLRLALAATAIALACPAFAAPLGGDFDCVSEVDGPDTPAGILRVELDGDRGGRVAFLDAAAVPAAWTTFDYIADALVIFDDSFAAHLSPGAIVMDARLDAAEHAYAGRIFTADGREVNFRCLFVP